MNQFGDRLKEARINKGMSQEDLAKFVGSTKQVVSKYENNQRTPKITVANKYAEILGVSLYYLLGEENPLDNSGRSEIKKKFIELIDSLSDKQAAELLDVARSIIRMRKQ